MGASVPGLGGVATPGWGCRVLPTACSRLPAACLTRYRAGPRAGMLRPGGRHHAQRQRGGDDIRPLTAGKEDRRHAGMSRELAAGSRGLVAGSHSPGIHHSAPLRPLYNTPAMRGHLLIDVPFMAAAVSLAPVYGLGPLAWLTLAATGIHTWGVVNPRSSLYMPVWWRLPRGSDTHSWWFNCWPPPRLRRDLERCGASIADATGHPAPTLFRPPVGLKNPMVGFVAGRLGPRTVTWRR